MLDGFSYHRIAVAAGSAEINVAVGGSGPPLLLLHSFPQTHLAWHAVASRLASRYSLVLADLRGYGDSRGPRPDAAHHNYGKRAMAGDMVEVMGVLGHDRFHLAGHDRGARVAHRLALDYPASVRRLAVLDILPTLAVWEAMDWTSALSTYHWLFLAQPAPMPERLIGHDPDFYLHHLLDRWAGNKALLEQEAVEAYAAAFRRPSVIEAACEDYRAAATIDVEHDRADREAGRRIGCPTLLLWGRRYLHTGAGRMPLDVWRDYAEDVRDEAFDCGHFLAEEEPERTAAALAAFFGHV
jgi:haloacetate dehalogenase